MRFLERREFVSLYRRADGLLVTVPHGGLTRFEYNDETISTLWYQFGSHDPEGFHEYLRERLVNPDDADELMFCARCDDPGDGEYFYVLANSDSVCDTCRGHYWECNDCEQLYDATTTTLDDVEVCEDCISSGWSWCEDCNGYYSDDYSDDHNHNDNCDCEAPARSFRVRNDGEAPLANDTRVTITLPAGTISAEGIATIVRYLRDVSREMPDSDDKRQLYALGWDLDALGNSWQTKEGNYTKRLSRYAYKTYSLKITPEILSQVGCIAREHSTAVDFQVEMTRNLNLPAEEFAHEDSCWWQSYAESRCALKSNGGFGLRTFGEYGYVSGRAWILPLRETETGELVPTFETEAPSAFVVFNGYGDLGGYMPARIVAHMAGMTYRKIGFSCSPMYVNNGSGYLVAPEDIATRYTDGSLYLNTDAHSMLFHTERTLANVA